MEKLFHPPIGFGSEQRFACFEEVAVVLDLPERRVCRNPLGGQRSRVSLLDLREIHFGEPVADGEVRVLGEEAEVRQGVHFGSLELVFVELGLREDVVDLQAAHLAEKARLER